MDGVSQVQARIGEIQTRFVFGAQQAATNWASAASAAGLTGTDASSAYGASGGTASESAVVAEAQKYLGVPYLWGGTDPSKGLDCSGFTQVVYGNLGIDLPRVSAQQATAGQPVASLAQARPGDLVFFDYTKDRPGIDHVGIYIGNGKMVAAPQPGESVKVQDVGNPTVIRRVLPAQATPAAGAAGSSLAGAQGLMQFMPATAKGLGVNALDPASAIDGAAKYLGSLTKQFGSTDLALAAYNAGPGTVNRHGGIPPYSETQNYVRSVLTKAEAYR